MDACASRSVCGESPTSFPPLEFFPSMAIKHVKKATGHNDHARRRGFAGRLDRAKFLMILMNALEACQYLTCIFYGILRKTEEVFIDGILIIHLPANIPEP